VLCDGQCLSASDGYLVPAWRWHWRTYRRTAIRRHDSGPLAGYSRAHALPPEAKRCAPRPRVGTALIAVAAWTESVGVEPRDCCHVGQTDPVVGHLPECAVLEIPCDVGTRLRALPEPTGAGCLLRRPRASAPAPACRAVPPGKPAPGPRSRPAPALHAEGRDHARHARGQQRQRIKGALAHPQRASTCRQRGGVKIAFRAGQPGGVAPRLGQTAAAVPLTPAAGVCGVHCVRGEQRRRHAWAKPRHWRRSAGFALAAKP